MKKILNGSKQVTTYGTYTPIFFDNKFRYDSYKSHFSETSFSESVESVICVNDSDLSSVKTARATLEELDICHCCFANYAHTEDKCKQTLANYYLNNLNSLNRKKDTLGTPLTKKDHESILKIQNLVWNLEKKFTLIQIAKIFIVSNPVSNDFKDFLIEPEKCIEMREKIKFKLQQRTSVLSYHILKGANVIYDEEFIRETNIISRETEV